MEPFLSCLHRLPQRGSGGGGGTDSRGPCLFSPDLGPFLTSYLLSSFSRSTNHVALGYVSVFGQVVPFPPRSFLVASSLAPKSSFTTYHLLGGFCRDQVGL